VSGTRSGSQFRPLSFGEFLIASNVLEPRKDGFYDDAHGIKHKIIPSIGDPNQLVMYYECVTSIEDHGQTIQEAEAIHLSSIVEISNSPTSSSADIYSRILLESMKRISKTHDTLPSYTCNLEFGIKTYMIFR
jgi:hypothetical protein